MNNLEYLRDIESNYRGAKEHFENELDKIIAEKREMFLSGNYDDNECIRVVIDTTLQEMSNCLDELRKIDSVSKDQIFSYERFYNGFYQSLELLERLM